jgi:signal peptidase I
VGVIDDKPDGGSRSSGQHEDHPPEVSVVAEASKTGTRSRDRSLLGMVVEIVVIVAAAFAIAMLVQFFLFKPFTIHQVSMQPTLVEGDRILLNRVVYHFREPRSGDVVVFHSPVNDKEDLVKRIVAVAGDRVAVHGGALYVNGVAQKEPYLREQIIEGDYPEIVIPAGRVFVMGDNRNNSGDSRLFGPLEKSRIIGEAFVVYWPIRHWRGL